jgi:hypothetical protein
MTSHYLVAFCTVSLCGSLTLTCGYVLCRPCCVLVVRGAIRRAMAQAVSRRPVTTEAPTRSYVSPCDICCGEIGPETGVFFEYFSATLSVSFHQCSILIFIYMLFLVGLTNETWGTSKSIAISGVREYGK